MTTGEWIKTQRTERGWSQDELAFRSHVSPRLIGRYERGEGEPNGASILKITEAFGISLPWSDESGDSSTARERSYDILGVLSRSDDLASASAGG